MAKFTEIKIDSAGIFTGKEDGNLFSASFTLFLIKKAWYKGCYAEH